MLRETWLSLIGIAWIRQVQLSARSETAGNLGTSDALFALDADHLRLLDDAHFLAGCEVHKSADSVGELAVGVWNTSWVVGDEETKLEFWVMVQNVKVLQTYRCCVIVGCSSSASPWWYYFASI